MTSGGNDFNDFPENQLNKLQKSPEIPVIGQFPPNIPGKTFKFYFLLAKIEDTGMCYNVNNNVR